MADVILEIANDKSEHSQEHHLNYLKDKRSVYVDCVIHVRKEVGEQQWSHVAHQDLAELRPRAQLRADVLVGPLDNAAQRDDLVGEVAVRGHVHLLHDLVDIADAGLVSDHVEADRNGAVDQDPFQGLDVTE